MLIKWSVKIGLVTMEREKERCETEREREREREEWVTLSICDLCLDCVGKLIWRS